MDYIEKTGKTYLKSTLSVSFIIGGFLTRLCRTTTLHSLCLAGQRMGAGSTVICV